MTLVLVLLHGGLAAVWLGAMAYSLRVVQPRLVEFHGGPAAAEDAATFVAAGARWKVVGVLAGLALTGAGLVALEGDDAGTGWWVLVVAKLVALALASGIFWYVSWRMWPRRLFATAAEVPAHRRRFELAGTTLLALAALASVLGVVLRYL
ncbi:hypothetical protein CLV35_2248 [Motilibacter peucedani]|uniref:Copper resistance protein D n=1 Tax=Motilibacter peucedani TaxID=598650 RepID=A0A420XNI7_9ACTN|nr:hypothetical protein [Motilibacter peucedani]RKS73757.1 hypothetical protein CLV35_2248 [Motilibacter peucedani]